MELFNVEFDYEGLSNLNKDEVICLFEEHIKHHRDDDDCPQTVVGCIESLCNDGYFELDSGYINIRTTLKGCPNEFVDKVFLDD